MWAGFGGIEGFRASPSFGGRMHMGSRLSPDLSEALNPRTFTTLQKKLP